MKYELSIISTTYNSSDFIRNTAVNVLDQSFNDRFEYIISDDASTDNTVDIITDLINTHPRGKLIKLIEHKENQGVMKNFFEALLKSKGDYIAFCDSDDLWIDPDKISKQIDYLKNNDNCVITYHRSINKVSKDLNEKLIHQFDGPVNEVMMQPQTSTMMVRGLLRGLVDIDVVNEAKSLNDQYLRFLLKDKGYFKPMYNIEPNIRFIRDGSIFSTIDKLSKKNVALQSWKTFYKYHGYGKNRKYLGRKVKGFQSAVNWLEYKNSPSTGGYISSLQFDIKNGILLRKMAHKIRLFFVKPLIFIRDSIFMK